MIYSEIITLITPLMRVVGLMAALITVSTFILRLIPPAVPTRKNIITTNVLKDFKLLELTRPPGKDSKWEWLRITSLFFSILLICLNAFLVITFVKHDIDIVSSSKTIIFLVSIFIMPIYILVDDYRTRRRLSRKKRSRVYKYMDLKVVTDYDRLFLRCAQVLSQIGASITYCDASSGSLLAKLP